MSKKGTNRMWAKIKCLFGFCAELDEIELRERIQVNSVYKKEPLVVEVKPTVNKDKEVKIVIDKDSSLFEDKAEKIIINKETPRKKKQAKKEVKETKEVKVKRSWYNNGKTQKLVPADEVNNLAKTWKKGKLPKKDK